MTVGSRSSQPPKLPMDALPQPAFEDLLSLASEITGASIAVLSLMDTERLWFRPMTGLIDLPTAGALASLGRRIAGSGELIVPDTAEDPRFKDHPVVTGSPWVRLYAAVPLETLGGYPLGTLCVADKMPHVLSHAQRSGLQALGRQAAVQLELWRHAADREQLFRQLDEAIQQIQVLTGLLPICSSCKRIRDDKGYWEEVDHYIQTHSQATFTHAVCPKCLQRLYPEYCTPRNPA